MESFCDDISLGAVTGRHNDGFTDVIALAKPREAFREIVRANDGLLQELQRSAPVIQTNNDDGQEPTKSIKKTCMLSLSATKPHFHSPGCSFPDFVASEN